MGHNKGKASKEKRVRKEKIVESIHPVLRQTPTQFTGEKKKGCYKYLRRGVKKEKGG